MAAATRAPPTASSGSGHQVGAPWKPNPLGRSLKIHSWRRSTNLRKPNAAAETGTPRIAVNSGSPR
jgi:hypothetical protein